MANKQVFTAFDVYGFKKALALHAAKNNALYEKWTHFYDGYSQQLDGLSEMTPTQSLFAERDRVKLALSLINDFLKDLNTPCDLFISKFEESEVSHG